MIHHEENIVIPYVQSTLSRRPRAVYTPRLSRCQLSRIPAFVCGPREARGSPSAPWRLTALAALRAAVALRATGLASLGLAELRKRLGSAGTYVFLCSADPGAIRKSYDFTCSRSSWRSSSPEVRLAHFCLCEMDLVATSFGPF